MLNKVVLKTSLFFLLALPFCASSHHSTSEYDQTGLVEVEGDIVRKVWRNPHVMLYIETTDDEGNKAEWTLEGNSISSQRRRGITGEQLQIGDRIHAAGYVSTKRENDMLATNVLLASGEELFLRGNGKAYWPDAKQIVLQEGIDPDKAAAAKADGLFRVWTWGRLERGWWFFGATDKFSLTDEALALEAQWNEYEDNPQLDCVAPGMPATMGNPYPIEFVRVGDNIELRAEEFDVVRTIHMKTEPSADIAFSHLGYSTGGWEYENILVVTTTHINWPYFNRVGVSQSDAVETVERFEVDAAAGHLNYELTVLDPVTLSEPYSWKARWVWEAGEVVGKYDCVVTN